jgi:hypothetical protein
LGIVYARESEGEVHTFGVSGKLIMNALVTYDHQTRTLWSQFLGTGVKGPLAGVDLDFLPVVHTQWSLWLEANPETLVLDKGGRYRFDTYEGYCSGGSAEVIGETRRDDRLDRKALVVGVSLGGEDVLVYMERKTETALVYDRAVDGRALTFRLSQERIGAMALLVDEETGTAWLALTGKAIDGPLKGRVLARAPSHLSFWFAWKDWNPGTELYVG